MSCVDLDEMNNFAVEFTSEEKPLQETMEVARGLKRKDSWRRVDLKLDVSIEGNGFEPSTIKRSTGDLRRGKGSCPKSNKESSRLLRRLS